ncbi:MAG: tRNA (adenosine(37)-N6)-threonylcarbamoyltransferase complex ATPase subunit type 1 TsaE [Synergistaceae bacterium]|nr:tRNA (adenosine(37)-N6)-threonylcarbamoyltransferase complex ATPase subunit type 1 TsaE [Synergistaceae bacterium]
MTVYTSHSESDTRRIGEKFAGTLRGGEVVLLSGDLGAGKTVFVRGVCGAFGVTGVRSPSFTLINEYESPSGLLIVHADLYRLDPDGVGATGLDEYAGSDGVITFVEWPERWRNPPGDAVRVHFEAVSESEREIMIEGGMSA